MQTRWSKYTAAQAACSLLRTQIKTLSSIFLITAVSVCGCAKQQIKQITTAANFKQQYIQTKPFKLASWYKIDDKNFGSVNIYLEGDGRVRKSYTQISKDPTPRNKTLLELASLDPATNVVYLARPCQYSPDDLQTVCQNKYWTSARYSEEVVASINQAIDLIKQHSNADNINLIGYSGGGTIAMLIAARRDDINSIRTIAGNLDLSAMQEYYKCKPLTESLDPMDVAYSTRNIPQVHFIGEKDKTVPPQVVNNFKQKAKLHDTQVVILPNIDHQNGWTAQWPELLKYIP